jgi:2-oxoglutarate dehydrogenase E2 component (dihydrolipoamide succinyltransferase)
MAVVEIVLPKLGESVIEATIIRWLKSEGEKINEDEPIIEIATDKVDSEVPAPYSGILTRKLFEDGAVVAVGQPFALLETEQASQSTAPVQAKPSPGPEPAVSGEKATLKQEPAGSAPFADERPAGNRFYSPLVRNIARQENLPMDLLDSIPGTGKNDRLTKTDLIAYLKNPVRPPASGAKNQQPITPLGEDQVLEMTRIRQLIAQHMVRSVQTSPHVTSFAEVDMHRVVSWREKNKETFLKKYGQKLTFTPVFIHAIARAVLDFPMINVSVDGNRILLHPAVNIGMAVALPDFNLIVPVIRDAGQKDFLQIVRDVNDLADRARRSKLVPDEVAGGTISLTNLGSFGTVAGTPIINQPQTAIVAVGLIKKRPVVIESAEGDVIAIRPVMVLSVTYDHRVIDGALGGQFLSRIQQYLENFEQPE